VRVLGGRVIKEDELAKADIDAGGEENRCDSYTDDLSMPIGLVRASRMRAEY
jgi:hypothetical protein